MKSSNHGIITGWKLWRVQRNSKIVSLHQSCLLPRMFKSFTAGPFLARAPLTPASETGPSLRFISPWLDSKISWTGWLVVVVVEAPSQLSCLTPASAQCQCPPYYRLEQQRALSGPWPWFFATIGLVLVEFQPPPPPPVSSGRVGLTPACQPPGFLTLSHTPPSSHLWQSGLVRGPAQCLRNPRHCWRASPPSIICPWHWQWTNPGFSQVRTWKGWRCWRAKSRGLRISPPMWIRAGGAGGTLHRCLETPAWWPTTTTAAAAAAGAAGRSGSTRATWWWWPGTPGLRPGTQGPWSGTWEEGRHGSKMPHHMFKLWMLCKSWEKKTLLSGIFATWTNESELENIDFSNATGNSPLAESRLYQDKVSGISTFWIWMEQANFVAPDHWLHEH